jgi:hypothetical protein
LAPPTTVPATPSRQVIQAVPAHAQLGADLVADLADLRRGEDLDDPGHRMARGPGLPGENPPVVGDGDTGLRIGLLGYDNGRTVEQRNVGWKHRYGHAPLPGLVLHVASSHHRPPINQPAHDAQAGSPS